MEDRKMIIFTGIQASGKTTFFHEHFEDSYIHINLDKLHTRNKERIAIQEAVEAGKNIVVDNTNPTAADRENYIKTAKEYHYRCVGYYFRSSVSECIERNELRSGKAKVPRCAVAGTSKKLELPDYAEGFDELYYVHIENGKFVVDKWEEDRV